MVGDLAIENTTAKPVSGRHIEVIPKSLAATSDDITSVPPHKVIQKDPIIAWDVTIQPGQTQTITYTINVPKKTDRQQLETWQKEQATALGEFNGVKPTLTVASPTDGQVVTVAEVGVGGTTQVGNSLTVNGTPVEVIANGGFLYTVGGLVPGVNVVKVVATGPNGQSVTKDINVAYLPPGQPIPEVKEVPCWDGSTELTESACPKKPTDPSAKTKNAPTERSCRSAPRVPRRPRSARTARPSPSAHPAAAAGDLLERTEGVHRRRLSAATRVTCWNGQKAASQAACPARPPISVAISGPADGVQRRQQRITCTVNFAGFTSARSIDWSWGVTSTTTGARSTSRRPNGYVLLADVSVTVTAADGRKARPSQAGRSQRAASDRGLLRRLNDERSRSEST